MKYVWVVLTGWDTQDSSPHIHKIFSTKLAARKCAKTLRKQATTRHLDDYIDGNGSCVWKRINHTDDKWQSYIIFDKSDHDYQGWPNGFRDDVIYIEKIKLYA